MTNNINKYSEYVNTEELRIERLRKRLSFKAMSHLLGLKSSASYFNLEVGKKMPTLKEINIICEVLGKPANYFFNINIQQ